MTETTELYQQLSETCQASGAKAAVDQVIEFLESQHRYHELFEALKMRTRLNLGLVPTQTNRDERLDEETELKIERGLLEACRRVGEGLLRQGKVREGWMYMRPVGDRQAAADALANIQPDEENTDALLEILVHEGVDVASGYRLALTRMGTCNSITLFETAIAARPRRDQQAAAALLVQHVHGELLENVRHDITQKEGHAPTESTLSAMLAARPTLLRDGTYHLDTTHLASTVRFARVLDDKDQLRLVYDLAQYGRHLHPQFQYPGEEPFLDLYPASLAFFGALLGEQVDAGIRYFTQKADSVDRRQFGNIAIEVLIDLLSRVGRHEAAIQEFAKRLPPDARLMGIAPSMLELSERMGSFDTMRELCVKRDDVLGFTAALVQQPA
ncbi:MAG: hypothetical protein IT423_02400 [Pirellulaceae bacterium]|nr:hypothetical protein [Pirellulaceae bacterium]